MNAENNDTVRITKNECGRLKNKYTTDKKD